MDASDKALFERLGQHEKVCVYFVVLCDNGVEIWLLPAKSAPQDTVEESMQLERSFVDYKPFMRPIDC